MIEIENLTRCYGSTVAVDDVSFQVGRGEIVGLLGHNGAGKTTLMKVLTGYLEPSKGRVGVGGHDVVEQRHEAQRLIGYLPEAAPLYQEMLVQDYLLMMAGLRGLEDPVSVTAETITATGLVERATDPIGELSKGLRQRVGIAQAILHKPAVLVLDEPTNGLDPTQIRSIRDLIRDLGQDTTVLLSTHILQEIEAVCDRVLVLMAGKLVEDSPLADLLQTDDLRLCVAAPPETVLPALVALEGADNPRHIGAEPSREGLHTYLIDGGGRDAVAASLARLAIEQSWRVESVGPEHIRLESVFQRLEDAHVAAGGGR